MKNNIKLFVGIIIGMLISGITVLAASSLNGSSVLFSNSRTSATNVKAALDELYGKASYGDASSGDILYNKKALVNGNQVSGSMVNRAGWSSSPTEAGKIYIPAGYHDGNGYVDTSAIYEKGVTDSMGGEIVPQTVVVSASNSINIANHDVGAGKTILNPAHKYKSVMMLSKNTSVGGSDGAVASTTTYISRRDTQNGTTYDKTTTSVYTTKNTSGCVYDISTWNWIYFNTSATFTVREDYFTGSISTKYVLLLDDAATVRANAATYYNKYKNA